MYEYDFQWIPQCIFKYKKVRQQSKRKYFECTLQRTLDVDYINIIRFSGGSKLLRCDRIL